ncbi:MAG: excinuclease ABC subunit UvrA [Candidatus Dadabacteria bacterium]|nr:excinuclease ABC subunit UvrA [Candidatus Dadabacteria bacterium]
MNFIKIKGARQNNLKNIDVDIPRNRISVITGLSGSGKSSLAFDTIFAEGQRRYMESLSSYARQFTGNLDKPDVDSIEGLSPSISVDQKTFLRNPRSTVGTITEIYDYLRVLFARIGKPYCYKCNVKISAQNLDQMTEKALRLGRDKCLFIYSPIVQGRKGEYKKQLDGLRLQGFLKVKIDGKLYDLDDEIKIDKQKKHTIEVLIDVIEIKNKSSKDMLRDAMAESLKRSDGIVSIESDIDEKLILSENFSCPACGMNYPEISPRLFSFNSPYGACDKCQGIGTDTFFDPELIVESWDKSISQGAIIPWNKSKYFLDIMQSVSLHYNFSLRTPLNKYSKKILDLIFYGKEGEKIPFKKTKKRFTDEYFDTFAGIIGMLSSWYKETKSFEIKETLSKYITTTSCKQCGGSRLRKESLSILISGNNIYELSKLSVLNSMKFYKKLKLIGRDHQIGKRIIAEILDRLMFLNEVGLSYLSLHRSAPTLSGGEAQRIRLASQVGSNLTGITYVLDEPTIGLHHKDNKLLINMLKNLRDKGNTIIVVEHDSEMIINSDHIIDIGKGAGELGGEVIHNGTISDLYKNPDSLTGNYMSGRLKINIPSSRRKQNSEAITIVEPTENNLKIDEISIPLGLFNCITGVSGSGKSTLINDILYKSLSKTLNRSNIKPGSYKEIIGIEKIKRVINVDQSPIGRTPRSNPVTYTGIFSSIRELFAMLPESKLRGYSSARFSFNVSGGRCENCKGGGSVKIDMHFLADVYVKCEQCSGGRYNDETLQINYKGKTISDVLDMTVNEALGFFQNIPKIKKSLEVLANIGLEYIRLGQPATTLSGGEAQRIKLSKEISKRSTKKTLYILDEPTIGLHFDDVKKLLKILQELVDLGNTVIVIEHNMDVIKCADYIIDLGPEGGDKGGRVVAKGTPEIIIKSKKSYTAKYLRKVLH